MEKPYDYVILGGGIVGISTAWQLKQRYPTARVLVLEKESEVSMHQTGHNSGVIHAGVYYQPGSLKAQFCREGVEKTISFCEKHDIPYDQCGKLLV
ncbi:FAD-dependent oxidoreductase, partial [Enterobacter hormaechei]|nr:FAD-dependent oxidoreductase [Enterobacter hormaechei]